MIKRLYEVIDGTPRLCDGVDYWKEKFHLQVEDGLFFNPFAHLLTSDYTFITDKEYHVKIKTFDGVCFFIVKDGNTFVFDEMIREFYPFYKLQMRYWNRFGITFIQQIMDIGIITKDHIDRYCSVIFYPPIMGERPADPYLLKIKEVVAQHKILGTLKDMMKPEYKNEDIDLYDYLVQQNIIEPIK